MLQVAADRQVLEQRDAGSEQIVGGPDAGHEEQVRGADHARRQDHFLPSPHHMLDTVPVQVLDALHAAVQPVQHQTGRAAIDLHEQIRPLVRGPQIRA